MAKIDQGRLKTCRLAANSSSLITPLSRLLWIKLSNDLEGLQGARLVMSGARQTISLYRLTGSRKRCRKSARRFQRFQKSGNLFREGASSVVCPLSSSAVPFKTAFLVLLQQELNKPRLDLSPVVMLCSSYQLPAHTFLSLPGISTTNDDRQASLPHARHGGR